MTRRIWLAVLAAFSLSVVSDAVLAQAKIQIQGQIQINGRVIKIQQGQGQVPGAPADADDPMANVDGVFLPPDRNAKRRLDTAKEMLDQKRYGEAVRYLGSLLEGAEDFFFRPDPSQQVYRSLKAEAGRLLGEMPSEGRESYELQFGARARKMLDEAVAAGDIGGVAEVSRRFFFTRAGGEATLLLGRNFWDHGRPLAAALCLNRLRTSPDATRFEPMLSLLVAASWHQAGDDDRAKEILSALKERTPRGELQIGGQKVAIFGNPGQALAWLEKQTGPMRQQQRLGTEEWTMFRGDATRNASTRGTLPLLNPRWRVRCADHPRVAEAISQLERAYRDQSVAALPSAHPLAVGNVVLMRTTRNLLAIDFATGKRIWEARSPADDSLDQLLALNSDRRQLGLPPELLTAIDQRVWSDAPFGTLSSDGSNVYAIEDLGFATPMTNMRRVVAFNGQMRMVGNGPKDNNRLSAFELKTEGKLKWEVGGPDGEDEPKLAGAFFLGPPLPIHGRLYAIAEMKGQEIRLVALSSENGKLEWSQQLAVVEEGVMNDAYRRGAGAVPSFADGILVCPTSAGAIVAVDLATRSLLWGFQYPRGSEEDMDRLQMIRARMFNQTDRRSHDAWIDATSTIADGKVLITPIESNTLFCLNLIDGSVVWKQERGTNLYVGGIHNGNALLIGRQAVSAVKMADGSAAWEHPLDLPSGAAPSGRGFQSADNYFLPLSSAEVAQIDLNKGQILSRARSRRGDVPGNLICFHGEVLSQGTSHLETFYQLAALKQEVAERLKTNGDDPQALVRLGEINFDAGNVDEATRLFRRAYELAPDDMTRDVLVESLIAGLRADFAAHRQSTTELEKLIVRKSHQLEYLRLLGEGLRGTGEPATALEAYLRIADLETGNSKPPVAEEDDKPGQLDEVADGQLVKRDRWLRVRLAALRGGMAADQQPAVDRVIGERLKTVAATGQPDELRRWIEIGGSHPLVDDCREALVAKLSGPDTFIERERLLLALADAKDNQRHPRAMALLAKLYTEAKHPELAAETFKRLIKEWPDVVAADGKTSRQIYEAIPAGPVKDALVEIKPWPVGLVESREDKPKRSLPGNRYQRSFDLPFTGNPGPFFENSMVLLDARQQSLVCLDGLGNERFRIGMGDPNARRGFMPFNNPQFNSVSADGHVLVYSLGFQLMAFDTLRPMGASVKPLWTVDLNEQLTGMNMNFGVHQRLVNIAWGENKIVAQDPFGRPIGCMGPITSDGIYAQRFRDLLCIHPRTGEIIWQRRNAPPGCEIFGDSELIIAAPSDGGEGLVLKAQDGELLGKCRVAPLEQRMATVGRTMLTWQADGGRSTMSLVDPWKNDTLWTHHFAANSKAAIVRDEAVGVFEPNGRFSLFKLPSGERVIHEPLESEKALTSILILRTPDQYLLVTNSPPKNIDPRVPIQPAPGGLNNPLINGRVYAFNRQSFANMWSAPVRVQNHGLLLAQPSELPVLVFLRSVHRQVNGAHEARASVLAIDKRNGRIVYKNDDLRMAINNVEFLGDRADNTISLLMPGKTLTFTCTDKPLPPEESPIKEKSKKDEGQVGRAVGGIFRAIDNAARRISGLPTIEEETDPFGDGAAEESEEADDLTPQDEDAQKAVEEAGKAVGEAAEKVREAVEEARQAAEEAQEAGEEEPEMDEEEEELEVEAEEDIEIFVEEEAGEQVVDPNDLETDE